MEYDYTCLPAQPGQNQRTQQYMCLCTPETTTLFLSHCMRQHWVTTPGTGCTALHQRALPKAVSHFTQAGIYGWLPLTAAYLKANQLRPALALLQHAVADSYTRQLCHTSAAALKAAPEAAAGPAGPAAVRQLAAEWAALVLDVVRDGAVPGGLTQLLFPSPEYQQLGTHQVRPFI